MNLRFLLGVSLLFTLAACDSSPPAVVDTGQTTMGETTTTTIDDDTCERVAEDTVVYLERLIDTLDETRLRVLTDIEGWPQELRDLQRSGKDLDLRVGALRCDLASIQEYAFAFADLDPQGPLSEKLLELLLSPEPLVTTLPTGSGSTTEGN